MTARSASRQALLPRLALLSVGVIGLCATAFRARAEPQFPAELMPLVRSLRQAGYTVLFAKPPVQGAYGATNARKKMVWVAPITVELGIARQTLIHEAVHAAQGCPNGKLMPIGWSYPLPNAVAWEVKGVLYRNYPHAKHDVEREAFMMQGHPRAFELIAAALKQRCR